MEEAIAEFHENDFKSFCGDCGEELTEENMWSEYTCKECAERLGKENYNEKS